LAEEEEEEAMAVLQETIFQKSMVPQREGVRLLVQLPALVKVPSSVSRCWVTLRFHVWLRSRWFLV
jgi:hypothetical protein